MIRTKFFLPITQAVTDTVENLLEKTKPTRKDFEKLDESSFHYVKTLELKN